MANKHNKSKKNGKPKRGKNKAKPGRFITPFAPIITRTLRYVEQVNLAESSAGSGAYYYWSPSSLYDPNTTGTGHQPMYFDQLCTSTGPYLKYRALRTMAKITASANGTYTSLVGWYTSATASTPASIAAMLEKPNGNMTMITGNTGGPAIKTWVFKIDHAKVMGITPMHLRNDEYFAGSYNGSPTNNAFVAVWVTGNTGLVSTCYFTVELDITAEFYSLAANAGSS